MPTYIHQLPSWPRFTWDPVAVTPPLLDLRYKQGRLLGRMDALGLGQRQAVELRTLTDDVLKTSEIEGEILPPGSVRSSVARRLGLEEAAVNPVDRKVEGVVQMTLDATRNYTAPLTKERLCGWHEQLFPDPAPWMKVGTWRDDSRGPMRVVSGRPGRERVHYEAPPAERVDKEMSLFIQGVNETPREDFILVAAQAHLWFVTVHPFDDGNGRIARAIADWAIARSEGTPRRSYSLSAQIRRERDAYYEILERTQKGTLDITAWLLWFLGCMDRAIAGSETALGEVFKKDRFWKQASPLVANERQRRVLGLLLDGSFEGKLTSSTWARINACSQDTAARDLQELVEKGILVKGAGGGRSTSYSLRQDPGSR